MNELTRDRVFISYAHEDLDMVREVVYGLKKRKLNVWFDKEHLGTGKWKPQTIKAINRSRYFVLCISQAALRKTGEEPGFTDDELTAAYNIAESQPGKDFTIVPVRLEDCGRGDFRISSFQQYDLFDDFEGGLDKLAVSLGGMSLSDATAKDERTEDEKITEALFGKAEAAYYANEIETALTIWNSVLTIAPNKLEAWYGKGVALGRLGRHDEALEAYDKALKINPDYPEAWSNKGVALDSLGRHDEALKACDKTLEINPDVPDAWSNKGDALVRLGRYDEALKACDKALEINPDFNNAILLKERLRNQKMSSQ